MERYRYGEGYEEHVTLEGGERLLLRAVHPEDKPLILKGFFELSPDSRWRRFLGARATLSPKDLAYLTELDGESHFALGAIAEGSDHGIAVARFVRFVPHAPLAEVAITILDQYQHRGLGKLLLSRLADAAKERGITTLRFVVSAENTPMLSLVEKLPGTIVGRNREGTTVTLDLALSDGGRPASVDRKAQSG